MDEHRSRPRRDRLGARLAGFGLAGLGISLAAGVLLVGLAGPAAAAGKHHGGLSHRQIIEIAVACVAALVLSYVAVSILRRMRSNKLIRESAAMPYNAQALLGRLPPGRDVYGNDLYSAQVLASRPSGDLSGSSPQPQRSGTAGSPGAKGYHVPFGGQADANMLSYELERLAVLRDAGTITDKEYEAARRRLLG